jgi:ABC-2 type transport system permease protein
MGKVSAIFWRELKGYFITPLGYVFIAIFLFLTGIFSFSLGQFYETRQASLAAFFDFHPWLYLFLVPAVSMRLWAEERRSNTIELLLTMPVSLGQAIMGKFFAAWIFIGAALALTFPMVLTVLYLGEPDMGIIFAGYLGSFLMAGAYLAIGCCVSAATKSQVISFVVSVVLCFLFLLASFNVVIEWFENWSPQWLIDAVSAVSFSTHYSSIQRGVIELKDAVFFVSLIFGWLYACAVILEAKKAS